MDFGPFEDQITDCCCTLHTELAYAVSRRARRYVWAPLSSALYDALRAGSHEYVSRKGRVDKLKSPDMEAAS
ncbi:hypothetical protein AB0G67_40390 [Streptomyces sp. NPDC021056]|uniref:hypothetical protein n=1 Tax=Streptomyces sp. NPDC021056 TaxID=3155012 RepID=UPI0033FDC3D6